MDQEEIAAPKPEKWDRVTLLFTNNPNGVPDFQRDIYGITYEEAVKQSDELRAYLRMVHPEAAGYCASPQILEPRHTPAGSIPRVVRKARTEFV